MEHMGMVRKGMGILILLFFVILAHADEGMWLLPLLQELNIGQMDRMGCELTAQEIYNQDSTSLKDMIGSLNYGSCTAGIISGNGLVLTNHHCGEDMIQSHSSSSHDYLTDGFWAMSREEELPNPGLSISFLVRMEDVTDRVLAMVHQEMTENERSEEIDRVSGEIISQAQEGTHYEAFVEPLFEDNEYYLVVLETFRDVRLVGAPPQSIGRFGGDTDNWEWPRHNADFCLMRIYTAPDGTPADYSPDNIPYRTNNYFPISLEGYLENDFVMVLGFPGSTSRYLTSARVKEIVEIENKNRIRIRKEALRLMNEDMAKNEKIRIQYTAKYSRLSNYYKYSIGQNQSIFRLNVIERRKAQEEEFLLWASGDSIRQAEFGSVVKTMKDVIDERREMENALSYLEEIFLLHKAVEIYDFAASALPLYFNGLGINAGDKNEDQVVGNLRKESIRFFRDFNAPTDQKVASALIKQYSLHVDPIYFPGFYSSIHKKFRGDIDKYLDHLYRKSIFSDSIRFQAYIENPRHKVLIKDPAFLGAFSLYSTYFQIMDQYELLEDSYLAASRKYIEGLKIMYPDSSFYPDANSTLRLSYGTVCGYHPRDAVYYNYYTTLTGVMEKEDREDREFRVPDYLKTLYREKDFRPYCSDSSLKVCFLTNLDTSGGNSGSPVLNAKGELIGLNFDGNWESMSGDIIYEPEYQRSICVDIRYILFIIDRYAGATHLINEMEIRD